MVNFRPHTLRAVITTGKSAIDPLTGAVTSAQTETVEFPCRVTPNGTAKEVVSDDGRRVTFGYLIHADVGSKVIPYGTEISVYNGSKLIAKGKVLRYWENASNVRIWL